MSPKLDPNGRKEKGMRVSSPLKGREKSSGSSQEKFMGGVEGSRFDSTVLRRRSVEEIRPKKKAPWTRLSQRGGGQPLSKKKTTLGQKKGIAKRERRGVSSSCEKRKGTEKVFRGEDDR